MPVQLVLGDMFEGPTDLMVVPCSTIPTVTPIVQDRLRNFALPEPTDRMELGAVEIRRLGESEQSIAQSVAFAASVRAGRGSSPEAIRSIGAALGVATMERTSVRVIAAPLLGTGAGGLDAEVVVRQLRAGFESTSEPTATLQLFVLPGQRDLFEQLRSQLERGQAPKRSPRVFVSYTGTSPEHRGWVADLATFLQSSGVYTRFDQWDLEPGMNVAQWMTNELTLADRVVMICDERYANKADGLHGGVGWEIMLVQGDMARNGLDTVKYIPVVRCEDPDRGLPTFLQAAAFVHCPPSESDNAQRAKLLRTIFNVPLRPPLGTPPAWL
ncbi:MAG: TIR domain-containing protein [Actinomycetota bacterium]